MKQRILFVDDEQGILDGMQRMLRPQKNTWEMHFASSGNAALELMQAEPFDVVVSDMRMPGMNGVEFLKLVREKYPSAVRIGLSGYSESEMVLEAAGATHQYLAKPCKPDNLVDVVDRSFALRQQLGDQTLRDLLARMDTVPVLPELYNQIMQELQKNDPSIHRVGEIVASDVGMSAKLLQLVNSAYFGLCRHVGSAVDAVMLLGLSTLRALVLQTKIFESFESIEASGLKAADLSRDAMRTASLSKHMAEQLGFAKKDCDYAFMAGMLHNLGKLVLAANFADRYKASIERQRELELSEAEAQQQEFAGVSHHTVAAFLLELWGLPHTVAEAVAYYADPASSRSSEATPLLAVHLATAFLKSEDEEAAENAVSAEYIQRLGLKDQLPALLAACRDWGDSEEKEE